MPGTGSRTASAGRCTPCRRRRPKVAAAIVAPVEPVLTIAPERPSATSRAARTTEASGFERTARNRVLLVGYPLRGRDHLDPLDPVQAQLLGRPEDPHPDPVGGGEPRPLGEDVEPLLRPEPIQGDGHAAPGGHHSWASEGAAGASATR